MIEILCLQSMHPAPGPGPDAVRTRAYHVGAWFALPAGAPESSLVGRLPRARGAPSATRAGPFFPVRH